MSVNDSKISDQRKYEFVPFYKKYVGVKITINNVNILLKQVCTHKNIFAFGL